MIFDSDVSGAASLPLIALVGRPNVGKSSLFNRLTRSRAALVDDTPGLTRDRNYGVVERMLPKRRGTRRRGSNGRERMNPEEQGVGRGFRLVDTGGFEPDTSEPVSAAMREQTLVAIQEADAIIFVTDAHSGPLGDDWAIADLLRRSGKPLVCAVNKAEGKTGRDSALEFHQLGLHPLLMVSATHGIGMERLIGLVFAQLPALEEPEEAWEPAFEFEQVPEEGEPEEAIIQTEETEAALRKAVRVAVVGCPNAGKSTLINRMLGEDRLVVSDIPGTTRDSIDLPLTDSEGRAFILVDTAGIRKKSRISLRIEKYSVLAAIRAMERAHVAVLLVDSVRGITEQDQRVANLAVEAGCGLVLAINKWDAISGTLASRKLFTEELRLAFPQATHAPVIFLSAKTGLGVGQILSTVFKVWQSGNQRVSTGALNRWLGDATTQHAPPRTGGRVVKIRYVTQVSINPPTFVLFTNREVKVPDSYQRFLENKLRTSFGFSGASLKLLFRSGGGDSNPFAAPEGRPAEHHHTKRVRSQRV